MEPRGGRRVERGQPGVQGRVAEPVGLLLQRPTLRRVGPRPLEQPPEQRLEVERGPADEQDATLAARLDPGDRRQGPAPVVGDAGRLPRVEHVDQVMRHPPALGQGRLGRADVHPPVERHRVERDDLGPEPPRQRHADRRLAQGGRAGQVDRAMERILEHVVHRPGLHSAKRTPPAAYAAERR